MFDNSGIMGGLLTGGAIFLGDMLLKPRLSDGFGSLLRFLIEGAFCEFAYHMAKKDKACKIMDNISIKGSATAGITIFVTDIFIRPEFFGGVGMEFIKFFLQGFIVYYALLFVL